MPLVAVLLPFCQRLMPLAAVPLPLCQSLMSLVAVLLQSRRSSTSNPPPLSPAPRHILSSAGCGATSTPRA